MTKKLTETRVCSYRVSGFYGFYNALRRLDVILSCSNITTTKYNLRPPLATFGSRRTRKPGSVKSSAIAASRPIKKQCKRASGNGLKPDSARSGVARRRTGLGSRGSSLAAEAPLTYGSSVQLISAMGLCRYHPTFHNPYYAAICNCMRALKEGHRGARLHLIKSN